MRIRAYRSFIVPVFVIALAAIIFLCSGQGGSAAIQTNQEKKVGEEIAAFAVSISGDYSTKDRTGPKTFDCSGFVYYVMQRFEENFPTGNTQVQLLWGEPIDHRALQKKNDTSALLPGDLIFFDYEPDGTPNHVGLYIGSGNIRHCWNGGVCTTPLDGHFYKDNDGMLFQTVCGVRRISSS